MPSLKISREDGTHVYLVLTRTASGAYRTDLTETVTGLLHLDVRDNPPDAEVFAVQNPQAPADDAVSIEHLDGNGDLPVNKPAAVGLD